MSDPAVTVELTPLPTEFNPDAITSNSLPTIAQKLGTDATKCPADGNAETKGTPAAADHPALSPEVDGTARTGTIAADIAGDAPSHVGMERLDGLSALEAEEEQQDVELDDQVDGDRPEVNQDLLGLIQSLHGAGEDDNVEEEGEEEEEVEMVEEPMDQEEEEEVEPVETALTSPLSDLPDLPSALPPSPDPPSPLSLPTEEYLSARTTPSEPVTSTPVNARGPDLPGTVDRPPSPGAESSIMAQRPVYSLVPSSATPTRQRPPHPIIQRPYNPPKAKPITNGKTKAKAVVAHDEDDDLCSVNEDGDEPLKSVSEVKVEEREGSAPRTKRKKRVTPIEDGTRKRNKLDPIYFQPRLSEPPEKIVPRPQVLTNAQVQELLKGKTKEVQLGPCLRPRYAKWGKCTQCVSKIGGDSCRFRDYRVFPIDPVTTEIIGPGCFESTEWRDKMTPLPREFNVPFTEEHMCRIERTVAPLLLPLITRELRHVARNDAIKRGTDAAKHRAVCDFCSSTIFGGWWFCKKCGRDYCLVCERYFADSADSMDESPWHLPPAARPRLLRCIPNTTPVVASEAAAKGGGRGPGQAPKLEEEKQEPPQEKQAAEAKEKTPTTGTSATLAEVEGEATVNKQTDQGDKEETGSTDSKAAEVASPAPDGDQKHFKSEASVEATVKPEPTVESARPRGKAFHFRSDLQPVSRFSEADLRSHWLRLAEFVLHSEGNVGERLKLLGLTTADDQIIEQMQDWLAKLSPPNVKAARPLTDEDTERLYARKTHLTAMAGDPAGLEERSLKFMFINNKDLTFEVFDQLWARGEPIVVDHVGDGLKLSWTPKDFIERFGKEVCVVQDCQTNKPTPKTVEEFFNRFQNRESRGKEVWKLKDWPQTNDFKDSHPDLYNDFSNALPVPDYTRREGVLNLYAHFPPGPTRPDIGPKMYNAFEAIETPGGQGSTRLHMDVADAVNVMLYASTRTNGQPGCAVWDLFRAQDADKIRAYLKGKYDKTHSFTDPIHSQLFYLDSKARKELADKYGVVSWRVYQYPGQAVFIPAGCAHQVCNLADCIKIALDFVSLHNVSRCQQLTQDFRTENFVKAWKEDVLQLYNVLWYAWTNVGETRQRRIEEAKAKEEEIRQREARVAQLQAGQHEDSVSPSHTPFPTSGFAPSQYGLRAGSGMGLYGAVTSSVRDEENTRSPSVAASRTSSPARAGTATHDGDGQLDVPEDRGDKAAEEDEPLNGDEGGEIKDEPVSATRKFAETLLTATLLASEPPPPPEARYPSAATRWGPATARLAQQALKGPTVKAGSATPRSARTVPQKRKAEEKAKDPMVKRVPMSQLIRMGAVPMEIAVSAARLQMGEGADDELESRRGKGLEGPAMAFVGGLKEGSISLENGVDAPGAANPPELQTDGANLVQLPSNSKAQERSDGAAVAHFEEQDGSGRLVNGESKRGTDDPIVETDGAESKGSQPEVHGDDAEEGLHGDDQGKGR